MLASSGLRFELYRSECADLCHFSRFGNALHRCNVVRPERSQAKALFDKLRTGSAAQRSVSGRKPAARRAALPKEQVAVYDRRKIAWCCGAKRQEWKTALRKLSSGHTAPCPRRSGVCRISPAFKWLTSLHQRYSQKWRAKGNGVLELNCWDCIAAYSGRNGHSRRCSMPQT